MDDDDGKRYDENDTPSDPPSDKREGDKYRKRSTGRGKYRKNVGQCGMAYQAGIGMKHQGEDGIDTDSYYGMLKCKTRFEIRNDEVKPEQVGEKEKEEHGQDIRCKHHPPGDGIILVEPPDAFL
jgi:hypothetical protein